MKEIPKGKKIPKGTRDTTRGIHLGGIHLRGYEMKNQIIFESRRLRRRTGRQTGPGRSGGRRPEPARAGLTHRSDRRCRPPPDRRRRRPPPPPSPPGCYRCGCIYITIHIGPSPSEVYKRTGKVQKALQMPAGSYKKSHKTIPGRLSGYMKAAKVRRSGVVQSAREASFLAEVSKRVATAGRSANKRFATISNENIQLKHNGGGTGNVACLDTGRCANFASTSPSQFQSGRTGDYLRSKGISIKLWLSNKLDRPNVMYRVMVVQWYHGFDPTTAQSIWRANASPNLMLASVDFDKFRVRYDRTFPVGSGVSMASTGTEVAPSANLKGKEHSRQVKFWIGMPGLIKYQADNGNIPAVEKFCLALYVIAYDAYGTLTTDTIATCAYELTYNWADA